MMRFGRLEWRMVIGTRCGGIVQLGVGSWRMPRTRERGPCVAGVSIKKVRAVSMGESTSAETDDEMNDRRRVTKGEDAVRMSVAMDEEMSSSGRPTTAESRLRINVFRVGSSSE
jgi:hypothetical protein